MQRDRVVIALGTTDIKFPEPLWGNKVGFSFFHFSNKKVIKLVCRNMFKSNHPWLLGWDYSISVNHIAVRKDQVRFKGGAGVKDDFGSQPLTPPFSQKTNLFLKLGNTWSTAAHRSGSRSAPNSPDQHQQRITLFERPLQTFSPHIRVTQTSQLLNFTYSSLSASNFADL